MNQAAWLDFCLLVALLLAVKPLGSYVAAIMDLDAASPATVATSLAMRLRAMGASVEQRFYRLLHTHPQQEMSGAHYAANLLGFSFVAALFVYVLQRLQAWLPFNPQHMNAVAADSAFNTAISFVTNTNWQGYAGESTMSYFTQMAALTTQNFVSAAVGLAVAVALLRGLSRHAMNTIGNFWVDLTRGVVYVLLPLSLCLALAFVATGVIQNLHANVSVPVLQATHDATATTQTLPMGPVASQEAIKQVGTNGGGFFNANSAHPFENPNEVSNFLQMFALLLIPFALTYTFGRAVGDTRQGWTVLAAMVVLLGSMVALAQYAEQQGNPVLTALHVDQSSTATQGGGNMEGKEVRFGAATSALFAVATTGTSTGAVIAMHDSLMPLAGLATLVMMQLGEVAPGGVGSGLYSMLIFAVLAVFIAGLMIGRTPEYLGKKIDAYEMKMSAVAILITPLLVLIGTAVALMTEAGRAGIANPAAHGFSEVLYAFTSAANNNGSAFAGLSANTPFYNIALGLVMWLGRFFVIVPVLAIAQSLAKKKRLPATSGTMPTHGVLFASLLIGVVVLVGLLTYVPALALGPIVEQLMLQ